MKNNVYLSYQNIYSSLGSTATEVVQQITEGNSGLKKLSNKAILPIDFYSSILDETKIAKDFSSMGKPDAYTKLEQMMMVSLASTIEQSSIAITEKVGLVISTTKGNIDVLAETNPFPPEKAYLTNLGHTLTQHFGFSDEAIIVSNACVSGIMAVAVAKKMITIGRYDHVFVVSGDLVSRFVMAGFHSFQALSPSQCQPYSKNRKGINIGEAAASILITRGNKNLAPESVELLGEASCNDANHISGPSRTGEGLFRSIQNALTEARISAEEIDYISAHGTATPYNDEMEAIALDRANLLHAPVNSLKGYFGHTLGASGLIETIVGMHSLYHNTLYASAGFDSLGVSKPIQVIQKTQAHSMQRFLKIASGFGGCNTAAVFQKANLS